MQMALALQQEFGEDDNVVNSFDSVNTSNPINMLNPSDAMDAIGIGSVDGMSMDELVKQQMEAMKEFQKSQ